MGIPLELASSSISFPRTQYPEQTEEEVLSDIFPVFEGSGVEEGVYEWGSFEFNSERKRKKKFKHLHQRNSGRHCRHRPELDPLKASVLERPRIEISWRGGHAQKQGNRACW